MSITQTQLLAAIKEVNTSQAEVGDVISYTITLTNISNQTITDIYLTDIIDKSLEVEENSIGINEVVSGSQTLVNLALPDLTAGQKHTVVFNAIIRRIPVSLDNKIRNSAYVRFTQNGAVYETRTTTATTLVIGNKDIGPAVICLSSNRTEAVLGDRIKYKGIIKQTPGESIKSGYLSIVLDGNLQYIPGSFTINGCPSGDQIEHLMIDLECKNILIDFEAEIIGVPQIIRALTSAQIVLQSASTTATIASSNEALVEIFPPTLWHNYIMKVLPCDKAVNIVVSNIEVIPLSEECSNYEYEIRFIAVLEYSRQKIKAIKQAVKIHYPYSDETQIKIWGQQDERNIKINILLVD